MALLWLLCVPAVRAAWAAEPPPSRAPAAAPPSTGHSLIPDIGVAFVYADFIHEPGWTYGHEDGRKAVDAEFGLAIGMTFVQDARDDKDAERVVGVLVKRGNGLIFETEPGYGVSTSKAARRYPKVRFEQVGGAGKAANLRTYDARTYEGAYLAGVIGGGMTKSKKLGVVASVPTPEVIRDIDAFTLGAQSVNPDIETRVYWVNKRSDPPKEAQGAESLMNDGADVLIQTTESAAVIQAAEKAGKLALGWYSDMSKFGPNAHLASAVTNWAPYYKKSVRDALARRWKAGHAWWGVKEGAIDLVSVSSKVPESLKQTVDTVKKGLRDGTFSIWKGPIVDQAGKHVLKPKQVGNDAFLRGVNFYVRGVSGAVPKVP